MLGKMTWLFIDVHYFVFHERSLTAGSLGAADDETEK